MSALSPVMALALPNASPLSHGLRNEGGHLGQRQAGPALLLLLPPLPGLNVQVTPGRSPPLLASSQCVQIQFDGSRRPREMRGASGRASEGLGVGGGGNGLSESWLSQDTVQGPSQTTVKLRFRRHRKTPAMAGVELGDWGRGGVGTRKWRKHDSGPQSPANAMVRYTVLDKALPMSLSFLIWKEKVTFEDYFKDHKRERRKAM